MSNFHNIQERRNPIFKFANEWARSFQRFSREIYFSSSEYLRFQKLILFAYFTDFSKFVLKVAARIEMNVK